MGELPREEKKRLKDIARYSQDRREQRYWELYWARENIFPAAMRSILGKERYKLWRRGERYVRSKWFDPGFVVEMEPKGAEDEHLQDWPEGPEEWVKGAAIMEEKPFIIEGASALQPAKQKELRIEKVRDVARIAHFISQKFFGRRFYSKNPEERGHYSDVIESILNKTMYGVDLHLVDLIRFARSLRYLLEMKSVKKSKQALNAIDTALDNLAQHIKMDRKLNESRDIDILEVGAFAKSDGNVPEKLKNVAQSWKKLATYQKLAALGPRAAMDGLGVLDRSAMRKLMEDRRFYKHAELVKAVAHTQLEAILKNLGKAEQEDEKEGENRITGAIATFESPYHAAARIFLEEMNRVAQEEGKEHISKEDLSKIMKRALQRIKAEQILRSSETPNLAEAAIIGEIAKFYEEYTKRFGRPPVILDEEDAKEVLWNMENYLEELVRRGPKHYFKGYVLAQLRRLKV